MHSFDKLEHFEDLVAMHVAQGSSDANILKPKTLPQIGYIAFNDELEPLSAGFLRRVEGGYGQIDTLVSNPKFSSVIRHNALAAVVDALLHRARQLELEGIVSYTRDRSVISRALACGFQLLPHAVISFDLKR